MHSDTMNATTEESVWNNSSPRLSFSQCLAQPGNPLPPPKPVDSPNPDFDFNVRENEVGRSQDSVHADELFFKGMILPLPLKTLNPNPDPDPIAAPVDEKSSGKKSTFWKFGRSASFNCADSSMVKNSFLRSYSTGTSRKTKTKTNTDMKLPNSNSLKKKKKKRWSGEDDFDRTSHVSMLPKEKGLIKILLCGGGSRITECK